MEFLVALWWVSSSLLSCLSSPSPCCDGCFLRSRFFVVGMLCNLVQPCPWATLSLSFCLMGVLSIRPDLSSSCRAVDHWMQEGHLSAHVRFLFEPIGRCCSCSCCFQVVPSLKGSVHAPFSFLHGIRVAQLVTQLMRRQQQTTPTHTKTQQHARTTCNDNAQQEHAAATCSNNTQQQHAAKTRSNNTQHTKSTHSNITLPQHATTTRNNNSNASPDAHTVVHTREILVHERI